MEPDRPKEEIARDMKAQAAAMWGPERAATLTAEIDKVAGWISLIARHPLELDGEEPDFLVAPAAEKEAR